MVRWGSPETPSLMKNAERQRKNLTNRARIDKI